MPNKITQASVFPNVLVNLKSPKERRDDLRWDGIGLRWIDDVGESEMKGKFKECPGVLG